MTETSKTNRPLTTIGIVTYNSAEVITTCLQKLPDDLPVIVVDNASADATLDTVRRTRPATQIIEAGGNLGYGRAANLALRAAQTPYLLLLNPDAWPLAGAIESLEEVAYKLSDRPILAPQLVETEADLASGLGEEEEDVTFAVGCALFFNRDALGVIGHFDEAIFLYFEETDLCRRSVAAGLPVRKVPAARVVHLGGASSGAPRAYRGKLLAHYEWSRLYFMQKHKDTKGRLALYQRLWKYQLKRQFYRLTSPRQKAPEYYWRAYGTNAYLRGMSAHELANEIASAPEPF